MDLTKLPSDWPQRQDSVTEQLADLYLIANRLGLYDAADYINHLFDNPKTSIPRTNIIGLFSNVEVKYLIDLEKRLIENIEEFTFSSTDKYALKALLPGIINCVKND